MKHTLLCLSSALAALVLFSGCMKVGPDYRRPDIGIQMPDSYQHTAAEPKILEPEDQWWRVFNDPELSHIVEEALNNLSLIHI